MGQISPIGHIDQPKAHAAVPFVATSCPSETAESRPLIDPDDAQRAAR